LWDLPPQVREDHIVARKLETFPEAQERSDKYPWSEWGDGSVWEIVRGTDFDTALSSMRQTVSKAAKKRGKTVRTRAYKRDGKEILVFQFVSDPNHGSRGRRRSGA
jgi:hypothetical protein